MNADELTIQSTEIEFSSAGSLEKKRMSPASDPEVGFESAYVHERHSESDGAHEFSSKFLDNRPEEHRAKKIKTDDGHSHPEIGHQNGHGNGSHAEAENDVIEEVQAVQTNGAYAVSGSIALEEQLEAEAEVPVVSLVNISVPKSPVRAKSPERSASPPRPIITIPDSPKRSTDEHFATGAHSEMDVEIVEPAIQHDISGHGPSAEQCKEMLLSLQMKWSMNTVRALKRAHDASPFLKPVDPIQLGIPDYFDVIKQPIDLTTIERKIQTNEYLDVEGFIADIELMLQNCFTYNPPNHPVHIMGRSVEKAFRSNHLPKMPKEGDELKPQIKQEKFSAPSPVINRPKRDVHPPTDFTIEDRKRDRRTNDDLRWCQKIHNELLKKQHYSFMFPFYQPVDPVALNIPQYFDVIKNPMDLSTMKKKLDFGEYQSAAEYEADFRQMVQNCYTFNRPGDAVYMMGQRAEELFGRKWAEKPAYKDRDSFGVPSQRGKKKKSFAGISDFDSSSDDDEDADKIQIQMVEQQIQLLQRQLEALRHKRRRKMEKRKSGGGSRRSSKGSSSHVDYYSVPASASAFVSGEDMYSSSMSIAAPPKEPKAPRPPKTPKPPKEKKKVGRPRKPIDPPEIREITFEEKRDLSEAIPMLSAEKLNRVVQIIHESMPHLKDNAGDEIELDIDSLDLVTLNRLWYFVKGGKKKRPKTEDSGLNASKISELEMELARMDGRMDKSKRFQGLGDDSASDSDSDESDTGSEA